MSKHHQTRSDMFKTCLYNSYIITGKFHGYAEVCTFVSVLNQPGTGVAVNRGGRKPSTYLLLASELSCGQTTPESLR